MPNSLTDYGLNDRILHSFGEVDLAAHSPLIVQHVGGIYEATPNAVDDGDTATFHFDTNQNLKVAVVAGMDLEIGAVEIKNATDDTRATVGANGLEVDVQAIAAGDNNIGNVDIVSLPAGNLGQKAMAASLSIVPASDITDATYIGDIKFGESLPAGTNAIGKLAANSGVDIGDVDVSSLPVGSAAMAASTPVTIASDDTLTSAIKTAVETLDNAISGNEIQADVITLPAVTIAAGQTIATVTTVDTITNTVTVDSELPTATALGDAVANPTTSMVGAALMGWDGAAWERVGTDGSNNLNVNLNTLIAGEDQTNDVMKTEQRFSYSNFNTDTQVKASAGFLHTVTFSCNDAAPTAGTIDIYDNTSASGTKIFSWTLTTAVFNPVTIILDVNFLTGLYVDFTTTADVNIVCSYR